MPKPFVEKFTVSKRVRPRQSSNQAMLVRTVQYIFSELCHGPTSHSRLHPFVNASDHDRTSTSMASALPRQSIPGSARPIIFCSVLGKVIITWKWLCYCVHAKTCAQSAPATTHLMESVHVYIHIWSQIRTAQDKSLKNQHYIWTSVQIFQARHCLLPASLKLLRIPKSVR